MKIGYFDTKEFESKDGAKSPFGETVVRKELEPNPREVGQTDHRQLCLSLS